MADLQFDRTEDRNLELCYDEIDMLQERLQQSGLSDKDRKHIEIRLATLRARVNDYEIRNPRRPRSITA